MKFVKLFQLLFESFDFNYIIPEDKELQLFDFYTLNFISKAADATETENYLQFREDSKEVYKAVGETEQKLLPFLKKELLDAVFFSICCEMRHSSEYKALPTAALKAIFRYKEEYINYSEFIDLYNQTFNLQFYEFLKYKKEFLQNYSFDEQRLKAYFAFTKCECSKEQFVRISHKMFSKEKIWDKNFGGKVWKDISESWLKLNRVNNSNISELYIWIDHIYDLQHNNGSVLNKVERYKKYNKELNSESCSWLKDALDLKRDVKNPWILVEKCSNDIQKLASRVLHLKGYGSTEKSKDIFYNTDREAKQITDDSYKKQTEEDHKQDITEDEKLVIILNNPLAIQSFKKPSEKLQLAAVEKDGCVLIYIAHIASEAVKIAAVKENPFVVKWIVKPSEEVQLVAMSKYNGEAIKDIKEPTEKVQELAIRKRLLNFKDIKNPTEKIKSLYQELLNRKQNSNSTN